MTFPLTGRADLHIHTTASDGLMSPQELLDHVAADGRLTALAITDHDRLDGSLWAYARRGRYPFDIIPGVEVSTAEGHLLALWVTEPIPARMSIAETAAAVHEQGGVAILAHPFFTQMRNIRRASKTYRFDPEYLVRAGLDGLEGYNAAVVLPGTNRAAQRIARFLGMAQTGGSDAHTLGAVGCGVTLYAGRTGDDLRAAILSKESRAAGRPWPLADYGRFVVDLIHRRGKIVLDEFDAPELDDEETPAAVLEPR